MLGLPTKCASVEEAICAACRAELHALSELEAALGEVPPEAFLDGPPEGGDLRRWKSGSACGVGLDPADQLPHHETQSSCGLLDLC